MHIDEAYLFDGLFEISREKSSRWFYCSAITVTARKCLLYT
jgi:hypothetical protein